jgi:hypothetical protein
MDGKREGGEQREDDAEQHRFANYSPPAPLRQ